MKQSACLIAFVVGALVAIGFAGCSPGSDELGKNEAAWPSTTLTLLYRTKAGSGGGILLRTLGPPLEKALGQWVQHECMANWLRLRKQTLWSGLLYGN